MKAIDYFKTKARMTRKCKIDCGCCPLYQKNFVTCEVYEITYPERAIEIVKKWGEENPVKTYMMDFMEKFPKVRLHFRKDGTKYPTACRDEIYGNKGDCGIRSCYDCWNKEMSNNVES